eukprot:jgi/Psemu1/322555/estExt_fgenesh1_pg.C_330025
MPDGSIDSPGSGPGAQQDPQPTPAPMDRDCAYFVRDALFPLHRDWGGHSQIHPALDALDRLRAELVDKRPRTMSYSNVFPRGVLVVARSEALDEDSATAGGSSSSPSPSSSKMEYNGQPDVDESGATVEVVPDILTVRCLQCNGGGDGRFRHSSSKAITNTNTKAPAFVRTQTNPHTQHTTHELVVCSDRVLQRDYHRLRSGSRSQSQSQSGPIGSDRREDLPADSLRAVEETLSRAIARLLVRSDGNDDNNNGNIDENTAPAIATPTLSSSNSDSNSTEYRLDFCKKELLAARASECLLARTPSGETRLGSSIRPSWLVSRLPHGLQRRFADRCVWAVANRHTADAARELEQPHRLPPGTRPRDCVRRAWDDLRRSEEGW